MFSGLSLKDEETPSSSFIPVDDPIEQAKRAAQAKRAQKSRNRKTSNPNLSQAISTPNQTVHGTNLTQSPNPNALSKVKITMTDQDPPLSDLPSAIFDSPRFHSNESPIETGFSLSGLTINENLNFTTSEPNNTNFETSPDSFSESAFSFINEVGSEFETSQNPISPSGDLSSNLTLFDALQIQPQHSWESDVSGGNQNGNLLSKESENRVNNFLGSLESNGSGKKSSFGISGGLDLLLEPAKNKSVKLEIQYLVDQLKIQRSSIEAEIQSVLAIQKSFIEQKVSLSKTIAEKITTCENLKTQQSLAGQQDNFLLANQLDEEIRSMK